jgi:hypothetical protein
MPQSESKASRGRNTSCSDFMKRHEAEYSDVGFLMPPVRIPGEGERGSGVKPNSVPG